MTENERLRALLAEARSVVAGTISAHELMRRIDAALAEPVELTDCERESCEYRRVAEELMVAQVKVAKERDEAWAEVERLKGVLDAIRAARSLLGQLRDHVSDHACAELLSLLSDEPLDVDGNLYLTPSQAAYQRGAEAMREAAMGAAWHSAAMGLYKRIQKMPVPEETK